MRLLGGLEGRLLLQAASRSPFLEIALVDLQVKFKESLSREAWAVIWKGDGRHVRDLLLSFGFSSSAEEALSKVEERVKHDPRFRRDFGGGVFYPVAIHHNLPVQRPAR